MAQKHEFRAETRKVLHILTHSLYTNREIFLRELLSNASDALDKLRFMQNRGDSVACPDMPLRVSLKVDKINHTLTVEDTGIGMSDAEMVENLGIIAHSGSENFLASLAESDASQIIGRFGIGFYSVFMVADKVEVISRQAAAGSQAHIWTSDGGGEFTVEPWSGDENDLCRGTRIIAHMKEDAHDFLEDYRLKEIVRSHSNFLPFPVLLDDKQLNSTAALWREPKFSITPEQYTEFYTFLTRDSKAPLDVIHLTVDAPVQFNALMFIPDSSQDYFGEFRDQWGLDLYVRRVLIQRANQELAPNWLAFLKGVVDTEDLPLNISRETLQENIVVRKIGQAVVKQTLNHLEKLAENNKEKYARFWNLHGRYFKFSFSDYPQRDKVLPLFRFVSATSVELEQDLISLDDYVGRMREGQKEIWYVAAPNKEAAKVNPHLERFRRKGLEVLFLLDNIDEFVLESLSKYKDFAFKSIEQADDNALAAFTDVVEAEPKAKELGEDEKRDFDGLLEAMGKLLGDKVTGVKASSRLTGSAACLASADGISSSMEKLLKVMQKDESIPRKVLEVNPDHPLLRAMLGIFQADHEDPVLNDMTMVLFDTCLLLDGYLNEPFLMADRTLKLLKNSAAWYADLRRQ